MATLMSLATPVVPMAELRWNSHAAAGERGAVEQQRAAGNLQ